MPIAALDDLFREYADANAPGLIVGVSHAGIPLYRRAWGLASLEHGVVNQVDTRLPIASITKQMTCMVIHRLESEGLLSIEDPLSRWLPEFAGGIGDATLRQVMMHTGGIRCYLDHAFFSGYARLPPGAADRLQAQLMEPNFSPGSASVYSNGGYRLLSWVIERATKSPLATVFSRLLFEPLSMFASDLPRNRWSTAGGASDGYLPISVDGETGWRPGLVLADDGSGDGGVVSSIDDLLRWATALRTGASSLRWQDLVPPEVDGELRVYGFGIIVERWRGVTLVHHAGGLPGTSSTLLMVPEEDIDIAILSNRPLPTVDLSLRIVERLLGDRLTPAAPAPPVDDHRALLGRYEGESTGLLLEFAAHEANLCLGVMGGRPLPLSSHPDRTAGALPFSADVGTGAMRFRRCAPGIIEYFDGYSWHRARQLVEHAATADEVAGHLKGSFEIPRLGVRMWIESSEHQLWVRLMGEHGGARCPATSLAPGLVRFWPTQFPGGMLLRYDHHAGKPERITVSTSRTWAIHLVRIG